VVRDAGEGRILVGCLDAVAAFCQVLTRPDCPDFWNGRMSIRWWSTMRAGTTPPGRSAEGDASDAGAG